MFDKTKSAAIDSIERYGRAVVGLLAIIAGAAVLIVLGIWGGAGR